MRLLRMVQTCVACCAWLLPMQVLLAQAPGERLNGDVVSLDGSNFTIKTAAGQPLTVALADNAHITIREPGDLSRLDRGQYVGVTAAPQPDGTLVASQISVFPESMRGTNEGHRPMANLPGSTMTNATVREVTNTVTTGKVTDVSGIADSRRLVLSYAGGEKTVIVPPSAAVVFSEIGDRGALVRGAHVVVYATRLSDGSLVSERVSVGRNGSVPLS